MQPMTSLGVTLCAFLTVVLWAVWPTFIKRAKKLRWELFFYDFILGALVTAVAAGLTLGTYIGEITFRDNLAIVGYRQWMYAALAGGVFGFGVIMFIGAVTLAGAAVAGSLTACVALVVGTVLAYFLSGIVSTGVQFAGIAIAVVVFLLVARYYGEAERLRKKDATHKTPMRRKVEAVAPGVVLTLCILAGLGFGAFLPLIDWARAFDLPMTAYPIAVLFAVGLFGVGFVLNLYFLNLPLIGDPLSPLAYVRMPVAMHLKGLLCGVVFMAGLAAYLLMMDAPAEIAAGRGVLVALMPAALGLFAFFGRAVWKEYDEALYITKTLFLASGPAVILASLAVVAGYI